MHDCYIEITAENNYELGLKRGKLFGDIARKVLSKRKHEKNWNKKVELSKDYLEITEKYFPQYVDEITGYAEAAQISFSEFWTMGLEDDFDYIDAEHCTTVVTNDGTLISHNEDWDENARDSICVLKKTVKDVVTLELYYYNTLGGVSICTNSYGYVMAINTLTSTDRQLGVPRNIIARWLSETADVAGDFEKMSHIPRSLGYNHIFVKADGSVQDIESSAGQQLLTSPKVPFVHTNHFLEGPMKKYEMSDESTGTHTRYSAACQRVKDSMTVNELQDLTSNDSEGAENSIFNKRTIGRMVIDLQTLQAHIWLKREQAKKWVTYDLGFMKK